MTYQVEYTARAIKQLKKLDQPTRALIFGWSDKNLVNGENPRLHGKGLAANRTGQWRYRLGDYRILAKIQDEKLIIVVIEVGHRREIYNN